MESDLTQYEVRQDAVRNPDGAAVYSNSAQLAQQGLSSITDSYHLSAGSSAASDNSNSAATYDPARAAQAQQQLDTGSPALPNPNPSSSTLVSPAQSSLATQNQLMSSYISCHDPDLPNQYNIIIAGEEDQEEEEAVCQTLTSPDLDTATNSHLQQVSEGVAETAAGVVGGEGAAAPYRSYTVQFKLNALDWYYRNGQNKNMTAKMFQVDRKRIRDWLLDEPNLRSDPTPERTKRKRNNCLPQYKEIETALFHYYLQQREKGLKPKNAELRAKSLEFAAEYGYGEAFKASVHWLCNWKRRNRIAYMSAEPVSNGVAGEEGEEGLDGLPQWQVGPGGGRAEEEEEEEEGEEEEGSGGGRGSREGVLPELGPPLNVGGGVEGVKVDIMPARKRVHNRQQNGDHEMEVTHAIIQTGRGPTHTALVAGGRATDHTLPAGTVSNHTLPSGDYTLPVVRATSHSSARDHTLPADHTKSPAAVAGHALTLLGETAHINNDSSSLIDPSTCEQWVDLVEQTVLSLETDVSRKLNQIKLLLHQIRSSLHPPRQQAPPPPVTTPTPVAALANTTSAPQHNVLTPHTSQHNHVATPLSPMTTPTHHILPSSMLSRTHSNRH